MNIYWGDLHNHCAISYGSGSSRLALDNARRHLDFCSITGHAFWPDMPMNLDLQNPWGFVGTHLGGFAKLKHFWKELLSELQRANRPGSFVTLPSYEWHSLLCGDYNCYAPNFDLELVDAPDACALARRIGRKRREFMLLPHHCGYACGHRGLNWKYFDETRSPLAEIYSNHGCGEADDAPFPYYHSMGPRTGESMLREGLAAGRRFGFYASSDNHDGYPGHYGHGRVGVFAERLDNDSIWRALKERRTVASTGVKMLVNVDVGDAGVGGISSTRTRRPLRIGIEGDAPIEIVELIEGGAGRWRIRRLETPIVEPVFAAGRFKIKLEAGWGHGAEVTRWDIHGRLLHARIREVSGCFRFSTWDPAAERSTEQVARSSSNSFEWTGRTVPNPSAAMGGTHFHAGGTQAIVLDIDGDRHARLQFTVGGRDFDVAVRELVRGSIVRHLGGIASPAIKIHRAIPEREFATEIVIPDYAPFPSERAFAYLRIRQTDGHTVWASPVWFE